MMFNQDILNFEDNNFFVCNNRLASLLESGDLNVMRKNMFPILELCIIAIVLVILTLNPKLTSDDIPHVLFPSITKPLGHVM
jgi:hypothetical protein